MVKLRLFPTVRFVGFATSTFFLCLAPQALRANLLSNPGFEDPGFLTDWTAGGNAPCYGQAVDAQLVCGGLFFQPTYFPNLTRVRTGQLAAYALVRTMPLEEFTLTQTVPVPAHAKLDVGFYIGEDSPLDVSLPLGDGGTQIFVDGTPLLANGSSTLVAGAGPEDFVLISSSFDTGERSATTVTFAVTAGSTEQIGVSFDDFFLSPAADVAEPSTIFLVMTFGITLATTGRSSYVRCHLSRRSCRVFADGSD